MPVPVQPFSALTAASHALAAAALPIHANQAWPSASALAAKIRRRLDASGGAFSIDFSSRAAASAVFEEGAGILLTDGSRACMAPSHLTYGVPIEGGDPGETGLRIAMDDQDVTCGHEAMIATGHLASRAFYLYGDFEWRGRVHHSPQGARPPANAFTCFSTFVHGSLPHNELAWCFPANDGTEVHMACTLALSREP